MNAPWEVPLVAITSYLTASPFPKVQTGICKGFNCLRVLGSIMDPPGEPGGDCPLQSASSWYVW